MTNFILRMRKWLVTCQEKQQNNWTNTRERTCGDAYVCSWSSGISGNCDLWQHNLRRATFTRIVVTSTACNVDMFDWLGETKITYRRGRLCEVGSSIYHPRSKHWTPETHIQIFTWKVDSLIHERHVTLTNNKFLELQRSIFMSVSFRTRITVFPEEVNADADD